MSAICRALEGFGGGVGKDRAEQPHGRHTGRGGSQGQQGPHRITEEFLLGRRRRGLMCWKMHSVDATEVWFWCLSGLDKGYYE